ncbi:uncharacterized protein [Amphiura filiformis]|uniref:uncharacterized protein n=1 Tax=Amphiura filiformis TaxID=82378 RepID=UPI003B2287D2
MNRMLSSMKQFFLLLSVIVYNLRSAKTLGLNTGDIRLVGGQHQYEGRVEIFRDGLWSTVCDNKWDLNDGQVVCRQLGFGPATSVTKRAERFGSGQGYTLMDAVECVGTETLLMQCDHGEFYVNTCEHDEDAGVVCSPPQFETNDVRLVNGAHHAEGRVEVYYNSTWGTICDNWWDSRDADVICRELGFQDGAHKAFVGAAFDQGSGPVWYDSVECEGTEERFAECFKIGPVLTARVGQRCGHTHDAGVSCKIAGGNPAWTITAIILTCISIIVLVCVALNIRIRGRKCWTFIPGCHKAHNSYPASDMPQPDSRSDDVFDRDSVMYPPPPLYDRCANNDDTNYESLYGHFAMCSFGQRTNSDSGVFQDDESPPSSPPPPYDSVSEYSRYILSTVHGPSTLSGSLSVGHTPVGTPITIRAIRGNFTPQSSPNASPQIHRAASRIWRASVSPSVSPRDTPDEIPVSPPPPYSETDPEEIRTISSTHMPSVE